MQDKRHHEQLSGGTAYADATADDTTVRIVPVGEGDRTNGHRPQADDTDATVWTSEPLKEAVEQGALDGATIVKGKGGKNPHWGFDEQPDADSILGRIDDWEYEDGVGPVGRTQLADDGIGSRIEMGLLEVSGDWLRRRGEYDEQLGGKPVTEVVGLPRITVVERGESAGATIDVEPGTAEALGYNPDAHGSLYEQHVSTHTVEYDGTSEASWDGLTLEDFDDDADLGDIADHFLVSQTGFPPETFSDLALEVVSADGDLNLNALESAYNLAPQVDDMTEEDVTSVRETILGLANEEWGDDHDVGPADDEEEQNAATLLDAHKEQLADQAAVPMDAGHYVWLMDQTTDGETLTIDGAGHDRQPFYVCIHAEGEAYPDHTPSLGPVLGEAGPFEAGTETGVFTLTLEEPIERSRSIYATLHDIEMGGETGPHMTDASGEYIADGAVVEINGEQLAQASDERAESRAGPVSTAHDTMDDTPKEKLREQLATSQNRVSELEDTKEQLAEKTDALEEQLADVEDERDDLEAERDDLEEKVEQLSEDFGPIKEAIAELAAGDSALTGEQLAAKFTGAEIIDMLADEDDDRSPAEQVQEQLAAGVEPRGGGTDDPDPTPDLDADDLEDAEQMAYEVMSGSDIRQAEEEQLSAREFVAERKGVDPAECDSAEQLRARVAAEGGDA